MRRKKFAAAARDTAEAIVDGLAQWFLHFMERERQRDFCYDKTKDAISD